MPKECGLKQARSEAGVGTAHGPPPERDKIDAQSGHRVPKAFEGPMPKECGLKQARSEAGVGTAHGLPPERDKIDAQSGHCA